MAIKLNTSHTESKSKSTFIPKGWIGVDFDGTLAKYLERWGGWSELGEPVPKMIAHVKAWIEMGIEVRVLTARVGKASLEHNKITFDQQANVIKAWCKKHVGQELEVTAEKDMFMIMFVDDACVQVKQSTGEPLAKDGFDVLEGRVKGYLKQKKEYEKEHNK